MSQFSSPWGDRARVSALKENLQKPLEYIPTLPEIQIHFRIKSQNIEPHNLTILKIISGSSYRGIVPLPSILPLKMLKMIRNLENG